MKGVLSSSLVGSLGLLCWYERLLSCHGCPRWLSSKYYFVRLGREYFIYFFQVVRYLQAGNGLQKTARRESEGGLRIMEQIGTGITINVPVVYMGRYKVVLRGDYP